MRQGLYLAFTVTETGSMIPSRCFTRTIVRVEANYTGYCNDEVDKLINQQSGESDVERRHQIVWQIEKSVFRLDGSAHGAAGGRQGGHDFRSGGIR
jgi:ABC-type transport system substrate-binding protein